MERISSLGFLPLDGAKVTVFVYWNNSFFQALLIVKNDMGGRLLSPKSKWRQALVRLGKVKG